MRKKVATVLAFLALVLGLTAFCKLVFVAVVATDEFNYQANMVRYHGSLDLEPRPEFNLDERYNDTRDVAVLALVTGVLLVFSFLLGTERESRKKFRSQAF